MMSPMDKEELIRRVKAMTIEELEVAVSVIPVEMCMKRIESELNKTKTFKSKIIAAAKEL